MSLLRTPERLFRDREGSVAERVTFVELFFDLVFVFAITQLSHTLLEHLTPVGVVQTAVMLVAVWWVWMYTSWVTNWMDPETGVVRGMLIVLMLVGLVLSTSIPEAFGERSLAFALAYTAMQVGRTAFACYASLTVDRPNAMNLARILVWFAASAPLWIVGAVVGGEAQLWLWVAAVLLELAGPTLRYRTPLLGASDVTSWNVSGHHMAERSALFIIIALGESVLLTGTAFGTGELNGTTVWAFLGAFTGTILLWLLYFSHGAEGGSEYIDKAENTGPVARLSYVYLHIPIVAGIVTVAVGDELVLEHPSGEVEFAAAATIAGGPALYLLGTLLFKWSVGAGWLISHLVALVACIALLVAVRISTVEGFDALVLTWLVNAVLLVTVIVDETTFRRRRQAARPSVDSLDE